MPDLGSTVGNMIDGLGQGDAFLEVSSWLVGATNPEMNISNLNATGTFTTTVASLSSQGPTGGAATSKDDVETAPFQCEYRWYNLCPRHDGPYPLPLSGSSEDFVIHLDPIQSLWMQTGWILMAFVGGGCFCLLLRCFVRARGRYVKNPSFLQEFGFYTRDRERYLEYSLGVLTVICFFIFADETCDLGGTAHLFFDKVSWLQRDIEILTALVMLLCFCLRLYLTDLVGPSCPRLVNFLTSPLMWFDLLAMLPTFTEAILQEYNIFPNLIWLRFPRLLDVALREGSGGEGIDVIARLVANNWSILKVSVHLLCAVWFACSTIHYLTECENKEMTWGVDPGYDRYVSIPSAMYYALIDFNGEFPNADEFTSPLGRLNSMVICLVGTYILSIPAGVLGAAFHDHVTKNHNACSTSWERLQAMEAARRPSKFFSAVLISLVVLSAANFIFLTSIYQMPVKEFEERGYAYMPGSWQRSLIAPCRYFDILLAAPFCYFWASKLLRSADLRRYLLSTAHLVDVCAWLPSYFLFQSMIMHGSCIEHTGNQRKSATAKTQLAFHGMCMLRWFKLDSVFGGMFRQLQLTLVDNKVIFRMSMIIATTLWLLGSVLMYYAERENPDEGTRQHFKTLPASFWMTALDFTSEAPINDHGAQGKAVHAIIMLLGVGLFTVPMGLFASAFRERLDEMHAKQIRPLLRGMERLERPTHGRRVSETAMVLAQEQYASMIKAFTKLEEERQRGIFRDILDVDDDDLMELKPGSLPYRCHRLLLGKRHPGNGCVARRLQDFIVVNTFWCCLTSCFETLPYFDSCGEETEDFDLLGLTFPANMCSTYATQLALLALFSMLIFLAEFVARFSSHPHPRKLLLHPASLADLLVLIGSLPCTIGYLAGLGISPKVMKFTKVVRLWRLLALERYVPAFHDVLQVIMSRGYQILQVFYVLLCFWFFMTTYNWYFLHSEFEVKSEDQTFAYWYSNYWFAMQFSLIHMSGDYPMTEYPGKVRVMHICSLFSAWAFVTMPVAMLAAAFHDALEKRRLVGAKRRKEAMSKIIRLLRGILLRRRFRQVVDMAVEQQRENFTKVGMARKKYPGLARLVWTLNSSEGYLYVLGLCTCMHVGLSMLRSVPQLQPEGIIWDVAMFPLVFFFFLNFAGRFATAFMNPLCHCSPRKYISSVQRWCQILAVFVYVLYLVSPHDERLLRLMCGTQMAWIFNFGQILGTSSLLSLVWSEIRETLFVMTFVSSTFWALSATLWYLSEEGSEQMTDMFSTLYYTCIFLLGEWCSFDFSPFGAGLSMLYSIVGVGLNAMPMAAFQDALTNLTDAGVYNVVIQRRKWVHTASGLSNNVCDAVDADVTRMSQDISPGRNRIRKSEVEMQVIQSLDQPFV